MTKIFTLLPAGNKTADVVLRSSCGKVFLHSYHSSPISTGDFFIWVYGLLFPFHALSPFCSFCPLPLLSLPSWWFIFQLSSLDLTSDLQPVVTYLPWFSPPLVMHCLHNSVLLSPSLHLLSRALTSSVSPSVTSFSMSFFRYFSPVQHSC